MTQTVTSMAKRAAGWARAVLLIGGVWLAGVGSGFAQAGVEAGALGAAANSAAGAASRATGQALGSVMGQAGAQVEAATPLSAGTADAPSSADAPQGGVIGSAAVPAIHFDAVSFTPCSTEGSNKVDLPMDGDYVAYHCQSVFRIIFFAYTGSPGFKFSLGGCPPWVETDLYNFEAKVAPDDVATWQTMGLNARRVVVQGLLADTLKLKIKVDTTPKPIYTLSLGKSGPQMKAYTDGEHVKLPNGFWLSGRDMSYVGRVAYFQDTSMGSLAELLTARLDRPVLDRTGLTAAFNFSLPVPNGSGNNPYEDLGEAIPSVSEGLSQMGLKLESTKGEMDGLVVEHIERPKDNSDAPVRRSRSK